MAPKPAKVYTVEKLKAKCQEALADPNLVDIARLTPNQAHDRAFEIVCEKTKDLQIAKKLAVATRFLAVLRRDHREEFEKLVAQGKQLKPRKKPFAEMEFLLPFYATVIKRTAINVHDGTTVVIQIPSGPWDAMNFCLEILNAILEDDSSGNPKEELRSKLIQLLEEKFGLKVKVCGNCKYIISAGRGNPDIYCRMACNTKADKPEGFGHNAILVHEFDSTCKNWTPKEN